MGDGRSSGGQATSWSRLLMEAGGGGRKRRRRWQEAEALAQRKDKKSREVSTFIGPGMGAVLTLWRSLLAVLCWKAEKLSNGV